MKYGTTLKIEVRDIWEDKVYFSDTVTLSESINSKNTLKAVFNNLEIWFNKTAKSTLIANNLSDEQILEIARIRGLLPVETTFTLPADLYYIESRTGNTKGHYIEVFDGSISCSCPGFVNNNKCWASTDILKRPYSTIGNKWAGERRAFYEYRNKDYPIAS